MPQGGLMPEVEFKSQEEVHRGRWRSKAILKALDNVKRAEVFENLRKANESVTMTQKMAILNATPNVHIKKRENDRAAVGSLSQRFPSLSGNSGTISLMQPDPMKPPTLKQLRMEHITRQIIEKTNAGLPIG